MRTVSIVVPFHNAGNRLQTTLESIAGSSHQALDVLLIDDASTDQSPAIARDFAARDARFRVLRNPAHRHVSATRNRGLAAAQGDYVTFVDSDDRISPDWIAGLLEDALAQRADIVIGQAARCSGADVRPYPMPGLTNRGPLRFEAIVFKDNAVVWNKLYARTLIRAHDLRFNEALFIGEDLLFSFRALRAASGIFYSGHGTYFYHTDHMESIIRGSDAATRAGQFALLLDALRRQTNQPGPRNRMVLRKVASDLLINHYRAGSASPVDASTLQEVRTIDPLLPSRIRLKLFRKRLRRGLRSAIGRPAAGATASR